MIMIDNHENKTNSYEKGVLDGLAMAIHAIKKLPREEQSSIAKLTTAIEACAKEEFGPLDHGGGW